MKQSKLESFIEACVNTMFGLLITGSLLPFVNRLCGIEMTLGQASASTILFTIISVARGYIIRRFFNGNIAKTILTKIKTK